MRALAAIIVVFSHLWGVRETSFTKITEMYYIGGIGVDAFFVLSGFIMSITLKDSFGIRGSLDFFSKRIKRIYPIYLVVVFPTVLYCLRFEDFRYDIIGNVFLLPSMPNDNDFRLFIPQAWTLVYEMIFYTIFALAIIIAKNKKTVIITSSVVIILSVILSNLLLGEQERMHSHVNPLFIIGDTRLLCFAFGCLYGMVYDKVTKSVNIKNEYLWFSSAMALTASVILFKNGFHIFMSWGIPAIVILVSFSLMNIKKSILSKIFIFLGSASYSIYLTHLFLKDFDKKHFSWLNINADLHGIFISLVAIAWGVIFYLVVERTFNMLLLKRKPIEVSQPL